MTSTPNDNVPTRLSKKANPGGTRLKKAKLMVIRHKCSRTKTNVSNSFILCPSTLENSLELFI